LAILFTDLPKKTIVMHVAQLCSLFNDKTFIAKMIQTIHSFFPFDCEKNLITLAKNSHKIPRKFIIYFPGKLKGGKFKALHKRIETIGKRVKDDELASPAQVLTLHTTHADRAFLSKVVMHNKQALSRFSSPFEAIQARLSACNAQFYVFISSTYVCVLERGKIWGFWGTWEFSQWQSLLVA